MRILVKQTLTLVFQIALLWLIFEACKHIVALTGIPIPANVLGIVTLFLLLCFGVIKEKHIAEAAGFLLKHLVFFFVPIAVGLMQWGEVFYTYGWVLLAAIGISALLPLLGVGWFIQSLRRDGR